MQIQLPDPIDAAILSTPEALLTTEKQQELFAALDYESTAFATALTPVRDAVARADYPAACSALATYLRTRNTRSALKTWHTPPACPPVPAGQIDTARYKPEVAAAAARGYVVGGAVELEAHFPNNCINWLHNETRLRDGDTAGTAFNPEWQWQLNRMSFWYDMAQAYRLTADARYPQAWVAQLRSFVFQCPPPPPGVADNAYGSTWRTIEAGLRMSGNWPDAFHAFLLCPTVTDADLLLYMHSSLQHGRHLIATRSTGNWLTMEMNGLYTVGVVFPEFAEAQLWRDTGTEILSQQMQQQFLPDGAQYELTPAYHNVALCNITAPLRLAHATGRVGEMPENYIAPIEQAWDFSLRILTPDRSLPKLNNSWPLDMGAQFRRNRVTEDFPLREDFRWLATEGREGSAPLPAAGAGSISHAFPYAGYYVMRSGWDRDVNYILLDAGPLGAAHVHQDKLNLIFYCWGRELLFDGGGGSYEHSLWRQYALDTFSHNTILVDGKPQRRDPHNREANISRAPLDNDWQSSPDYDSVRGIYNEGYGSEDHCPVTHIRRVYFHKPDLLILADTLIPCDDKPHDYQARWHLMTTQTRIDAKSAQVLTTDVGLSNLAIVPLGGGVAVLPEVATASGQVEPEILGWDIRKDTIPQCVPATTVTHDWRDCHAPQTFLTLLVPLRKNDSTADSPVRAVKPASEATPHLTEVTLRDGRHLRIDTGTDPMASIRVNQSTAAQGA